MTTTAPAGAGARPSPHRGWALPPRPPEEWVDPAWGGVLLALLAASLLVPLSLLLRDAADVGPVLAAAAALTSGAAALGGFLLLVQSSVTGERRLRWLAGGCALAVPCVLLRAIGTHGTDGALGHSQPSLSRAAALGLLVLVVLPLTVLTARLAARSLRLLAWPAAGLAAGATLAAVSPGPLGRLVGPDGTHSPALSVGAAGAAVLAAVAARSWWRRGPATPRGPWTAVLAGLVLTGASGLLLAVARERSDALWWLSLAAEDGSFVLLAAGLLAGGSRGYFRQARRWHQLEAEVRALRTSTALLPGRSVTPEDEAGLPEEDEVRALVEQRRLLIALQPVLHLRTGAVVGHEALSRFSGRTPTDRWFRAASHYGLGGELERVTLEAALHLLPALPDPTFLAVNVSPAALSDPVVLDLLHACDLRRVVVEITEHEAVADYPQAREALDGLRADGARIAVDDTGAGFASLRHVLQLQPDVIKLDISITRDVEHDPQQQALIRALLSFAQEVGSEVLAEGVETEAQLRALVEIGVPIGQGWHLGIPEIVQASA